MKFNLKKLYKSALVGVASLALIIPLASGNGTTASASEHHSLRYYENCLIDSDYDYNYDNPIDQLSLFVKHPALRHTHDGKLFMSLAKVQWDGYAWDYYARHYTRIYSPYLKHVMPTHVELPNYTRADYYDNKRDNYLIRRGEQKVGVLKHSHKARRHVRHHAKHHIRKRTRRSHKHTKHGRRYKVIPIND